ncbi:hypothetical protein [Xenorhabdus kozodoii]|uniref:Uncharacterized protein n=1 Tax=Xenorhabdus kozodoii TaxID=351676 RepID=A0A2D0LFZ4_9GAMM|nr:hypothetical protein [Xenorhabdus kozodoii]PHM74619.1 hypothetical protein Xkoz_00542 [Xenorhabdus kozodoii]
MKLYQLIFAVALMSTLGVSHAGTLQKKVKFDPSWCKYYCMREAEKTCGSNEKCYRHAYKGCMDRSAAAKECRY